jgi:hypothetical protein
METINSADSTESKHGGKECWEFSDGHMEQSVDQEVPRRREALFQGKERSL